MYENLDPVKYEMFRHRLFNVLEEGRITMARVSGSPVISEGGECMTSIYDGRGDHISTAAGLLFHCTGSREAIYAIIKWYEDDPGIFEGDQFFCNDPYIAGTHVNDEIVVAPVFYQGRRVAWVGSMMHTSDTGGVLRGQSTEIFHEGIRFQGIKIVERSKYRADVGRSIVQQCRDPDYVALDMKAKVAGNNVCARGYLGLVENYGIEFVEAASQKVIEEGEKLARARLRSLPDGTWRARSYLGDEGAPTQMVCTMTKKGEEVVFDATGTGPQNPGWLNATLRATWGTLFTALAGELFWNVPWNGGMTKVVRLVAPEATMLNCRFPASCNLGTRMGLTFAALAHECIARMLYAAGVYEDVTAGWSNLSGRDSGPGWFYGGHNQYGLPVGQGVYDNFGAGQGAAPYRDGVDSGGSSANAQSMISDVEHIEMNYPFLYLGRNHMADQAGPGEYRGGQGPERVMMVYGSRDLTVNYRLKKWGARSAGWGLFGGYPFAGVTNGGTVLVTSGMEKKRLKSRYPTTLAEMGPRWGRDIESSKQGKSLFQKTLSGARVHVREWDIIEEPLGVGGGFGDPLDRDPGLVLKDIKEGAYSAEMAREVYGVVLDEGLGWVDEEATRQKRREMLQQRLREGKPVTKGPASGGTKVSGGKVLLKPHEYVEIVELEGGERIYRCVKCSRSLGPAGDNYKKHTHFTVRNITGASSLTPENQMYYHEYFCPGCGTMLQVDLVCPALEKEPLWDIQVDV
ncbi:MAG: hydantoinase B/oxoprolinase family protein [Chloroflexi bacterium]|nr:hydantoinase B/oxoprolinase family protein [Chloroflexota bacterium]